MYKQKINKLLIGTNNKGKLREIKSLLPKKIKIYSTSTFNLRSPVENGKTFKENSLIKSKYFSKKTRLLCLADDSGLEIDFLNKSPGIYSARWGGKYGDFSKAIKRVYRELNKKDKNWKNKKIKARFICALSISYLNKKIACVQPKKLCKRTKKALKKGSITNIAQSPNTTDGIAANNSTKEPIISLIIFGTKFSVINIAVPTPRGIVINNERNEVTNVPYIAVKAPYSSFTGFHSEVTRNFSPYLEKDSND